MSVEHTTRTACSLCWNLCGLIAHSIDGKVVKVEGDPENPHSHGHLCAKGLAGHLSLYSPRRITKPLIRTNPRKGLDEDPRWKEVSWEEALQLFSERIRAIRADPRGYDGRRIMFATFDHWNLYYSPMVCWLNALQAHRVVFGAGCFCGNGLHPQAYLNLAAFELTPDMKYAEYVLLVGAQTGSIIQLDIMSSAKYMAEKRPGGIKVVAVSPVCAYAASRAEEWIPIRPGTDAAFLLALANLLVNELKIYDAAFLTERTNAPYLIGEDGHYLRDRVSAKPLVWDAVEGKAKPFDSQIQGVALDGEYRVGSRTCRPAFQVLKDHLRSYTPERAEEITSIPGDTTRRVAKEMAEAAHIGATIEVEGQELPYRPVTVAWYRGISAHKHGFLTGNAALLIPTILGAIQVPGGLVGILPEPEDTTEDGLMAARARLGVPYPPRPVVRPSRIDLFELFPVAVYSWAMIVPALLQPERWVGGTAELVRPELLIIYRDNAVKNIYSPEIVVEALRTIPFIVSFAVEPDETTRVADLVFPDLHHLEKLSESLYFRINEPGLWYGAKPATKPPFEPPYDHLVNNAEILLEVAKRAGFIDEVYRVANEMWGLKGTEYELDPKGDYKYLELIDRRLRSMLGKEHGLEWFLRPEGSILKWNASPTEHYKGPFRKSRIHLYHEFMLSAGESLTRLSQEMGIEWDTSDYLALPVWKPCPSFTDRIGDFDLFVVNYKVPIQIHGVGRFNPFLRQLVEARRLEASLVHPVTAARKGIKDGDLVWLETPTGRRTRSVILTSERVHPEVVATMQHRISSGADFNSLLVLNRETLDFVGCTVDSCLLVKVSKAEQASGIAPHTLEP